MYRTLLVPLDGSTLAERALPVATALAHATGGRIVLMRAAWARGVPGWELEKKQENAAHQAEIYLHSVAADLRSQDLTVDVRAIPAAPDQGILWTISDEKADLVVMCTHGRSGLGRVVYGSVAEKVLVQSHVPVLLVRAGSPTMPEFTPGKTTLLVALDGSPIAESVIPYASEMARALNASLTLLRVVVPPPLLAPERMVQPELSLEIYKMELDDAESYLASVAKPLRQNGLLVKTMRETGGAAATILRKSEELNPAFVIMATHGRAGLERLVFGSVAMDVLHRGAHPVMMIRPLGLIRNEARHGVANSMTGRV